MKTKKKLPAIVQLAILTTITTVVWISFEVYRSLTDRPAPSVSGKIIDPIDPELNRNALDKLQQSIYLEEEQIGDIAISPSQTSAPEITVANEELQAPVATETTEESETNE